MAQFKALAGCSDCGISNPIVLDFDHIADDKMWNVAEMVGRVMSWKRIEQEIKKCEVVCANCHRIRTHMRRVALSADLASGSGNACPS